MINLLLSGNNKVFDGALTELISITNKTKETVNCYILTMDVDPEVDYDGIRKMNVLDWLLKNK